MNDNEKQFEDFVSNIKFDDTPDIDHRDKLEQNLLRVMAKQSRQIKIRRFIMKSQITKLATAAVIAIVVLGGISFWPGGGSDNGKWWLGPPAAWGKEILASLDTFKAVTCHEQNVLVLSDGSEHTSMTWNILYVSSDSYRRDIYDDDFLREIQWYVPEGGGTYFHSIRYDTKSYFTHSGEWSFGNQDPVERMRSFVSRLDEADRLLGEEVIDGYSCVGFEISAGNSEDRVDCIWFDTQTKLPVRIEIRGMQGTNQPDETSTVIQEQFDYNPALSPDTFIPQTPAGFIHAHPDEIQAAKERQQKE